MNTVVHVTAHRGARSLAPENTLPAAQLAFDAGSHMWETDVRITRDGHLILFHDETLLRCTNVLSRFPSRARNPVNTFSLSEILSLDAGAYFENTDPFGQVACGNVSEEQLLSYRRVQIPTLEQGLVFTRKNNWKVNLELKMVPGQKENLNLLPEKTIEMVYRTGLHKTRIVISSFFHPWLDWILKNCSGIEVQALIGKKDEDLPGFEDFRFSTYNINAQLVSKSLVEDLKVRNKKVNLFTVNDKKAFEDFVKMGVDGIITDFPQRFPDEKKIKMIY